MPFLSLKLTQKSPKLIYVPRPFIWDSRVVRFQFSLIDVQNPTLKPIFGTVSVMSKIVKTMPDIVNGYTCHVPDIRLSCLECDLRS